MSFLLDTHTLLWFLFNSPELSKKALEKIQSNENVYVSIISLWEIEIKKSIKKLDIDYSCSELVGLCGKENIDLLQVLPKHIDKIKDLPFIHRDPFDRLLIAQAQSENLTIITKDLIIPKYDVKTMWE